MARNKQELELLGRLTELARRIEGDKSLIGDCRRARALEERIGGGFTLDSDISEAEALLAKYDRG